MTTRELYTMIVNGTEITEEMRATAAEFIEKMDNTNAKRKAVSAEKAAERQAEKAPVREALFNTLVEADEPLTATELIDAAGVAEQVKGPASIPSLLRPLVEEGRVLKVEKKITGKGKQRAYTCA